MSCKFAVSMTTLVLWILVSARLASGITMDKLNFKVGEFLIYSVLGKDKNLDSPHHYMVALSSEEAMDVRRTDESVYWCNPRILSKRRVPEYLKNHLFDKRPVEYENEIIGWEKTLALAKRMEGTKLPYDTCKCNCKHYAYYAVYGRTFSTWCSITYRSPASDCPVAKKISKNTDVYSDSFQLEDSTGKVWPINPLTKDDREWIRERLAAMKGGSRSNPGSSSKPAPKPAPRPAASPQFRPSYPSPMPSPSRPVGGYSVPRAQSQIPRAPTGQGRGPAQGRPPPAPPAPRAPSSQTPAFQWSSSGQYMYDSQGRPLTGSETSWARDPYESNPDYLRWRQSKQNQASRRYT